MIHTSPASAARVAPVASPQNATEVNHIFAQVAEFIEKGNLTDEQLTALMEIISNRLSQSNPSTNELTSSNLFASGARIEHDQPDTRPVTVKTSAELVETANPNQIKQDQSANQNNIETKWNSLISAANKNIPQFEAICNTIEQFKNLHQHIRDFIPKYLASPDNKNKKDLTLLRIISILNILVQLPAKGSKNEKYNYINKELKSILSKYPALSEASAQDFVRSFLTNKEELLELTDSTKQVLKNYLLALKVENNIRQILRHFENFPTKNLTVIKMMIINFYFLMKEDNSFTNKFNEYKQSHLSELWELGDKILLNENSCFEEIRSLSQGYTTHIKIGADNLQVSQGIVQLLERLTEINESMEKAANNPSIIEKAQNEEKKIRELKDKKPRIQQQVVHVKMTADQIFKIVEDATSKHRRK